MGREFRLEERGWNARRLEARGQNQVAWCAFPAEREASSENATIELIGEHSEVLESWTFRRSVLSDADRFEARRMAARFDALTNVVCMGERATGVPLSVEREMEQAASHVSSWFDEDS